MRDYAEEVKRLRKYEKMDAYSRYSPVCRDAADVIEELLAAVPRWISVEERLPKIGECGMSDGVYVTDGEYIAYAFLYQAGDDIFWSCAAGIDIFYWCEDFPLPAPPKEDT